MRLSRAHRVDDPAAWLTTVATRLCLDNLRKRSTRALTEAQVYAEAASVGPKPDPEADALLAERVGDAMQVVLDGLAPAERAAFVLHDVFGYSFDEISAVLGRSGAAVRQLASRARRKVQGVPEPAAERAARAESRQIVDAFLAAAHGGELANLLSLLAPDAVMRADLAVSALARSCLRGRGRCGRALRRCPGASLVAIDGDRGGAWIVNGAVKVAFIFQIETGLVREIELIADPEVLATMDVVPDRGES